MQTTNLPKFSVAMSVYKNDTPSQLSEALESVCTQSLPADEIYLVIDGPIGDELKEVIDKYSEKYGNFTINQLDENKGLGNALRIAVENCRHDLILRMDSDDICAPGRFKKQITAYVNDPADVIGGHTLGFVDDLYTGKITASRRKLTHEELMKVLRKGTPVSHVTVLLRREAVLKAGNYIELFYHEDYYLWARMAKAGCRFRNLPDVLVYVRIGKNQALRHGGLKYYKSGAFLRKYMLKNKLITKSTYLKETAKRIVYQLILPARARNYIKMKYRGNYLSREEADAVLARNKELDELS